MKRFAIGIFLLAFLSTLALAAGDSDQNVCTGNPNQWRQL